MYIDIHTHKLSHHNDITTVYDCKLQETPPASLFNIGIHPWDVNKYSLKELEKKLKVYNQSNFLFAIGETGLDKLHYQTFNKQKEYFNAQLVLAKKLQITTLIIHCVKAYNEIFEILKKSSFKGQIIFHDFNANINTATQFLKHFDCYFSFGIKLFNHKTKAYKTFTEIDLKNVFLETDDQNKYGIGQIYSKAAQIRSLELEELSAQLSLNFKSIN